MAKIFKNRKDVAYFDYKDFKTLQRYLNVYGTESQQKHLSAAIKKARHIALLPFVSNN